MTLYDESAVACLDGMLQQSSSLEEIVFFECVEFVIDDGGTQQQTLRFCLSVSHYIHPLHIVQVTPSGAIWRKNCWLFMLVTRASPSY